jgi:phage virion morphogenesis protein
MADDLRALEDWVAPLLAKLTSAERRKLARTIGTDLRRAQTARIASQRNPDGSAYAPRKTTRPRQQRGRIRQAMFAKLRTASHLKLIDDANSITIGFTGRVSRIARVHQYGLRDEVTPGGLSVEYPARELLGLTTDDRELVKDLLLKHLAP